jgi:hypothetical protein
MNDRYVSKRWFVLCVFMQRTLPPDALARLSDISRAASPEPVTGMGAHH